MMTPDDEPMWMPAVAEGCFAPDPGVLDEIDAVRESWARTCIAFGAELDGAIGAITAANAATAIKTDHEQAEQLLNELAVSNLHGPSEVGEWWNGLTDGQRLTLLSTFPGPLSRLDGIPAKARAIAARTQSIEELMRLEAAEADGTLTPQQQRRLAHLRATLGGVGEETGRSADPDVVHFLPGSLPINGPRRQSPD